MALRPLKPLEIAEGALLADVAVIFQVLATYVPIVGDFFRIPIFIVLTVLVLRRGLYVGIMGACVALFVAGIIMGPLLVIFLGIEMLGGLFLGVTMKYRLRHSLLILLGAFCGSAALYCLFAVVGILTGISVSSYTRLLHQLYDASMQVGQMITLKLGLAGWWQQSLVPVLSRIGNFLFTYWWFAIYLVLWCFALVMTTLIYTATNICVRLLGYDVRPFPDQRIQRVLQRLRKRLFKLALRRGVIRRQHVGG